MDTGWIASVTGFAIAMAATPGPNNTLVTASGANHGFRRSLPLMSGIALGVATIILLVSAVGVSAFEDPLTRNTIKWLGLAYLLWLAWKIGSARPTVPGAGGGNVPRAQPLSFAQGALLQLINPKLWIMVAGGVVTYGGAAQVYGPIAIAVGFSVIFGVATFASVTLWTLLGVGAGRGLRTARQMRIFNFIMATVLVASLLPVMFEP